MPKYQKLLLILAAAKNDSKKDRFVVDLCQEYGEICQSRGISVDWIDLYLDTEKGEFEPCGGSHQKDAKIIEYQLRIKKADCLIFFHPVRWNSVPAVLKGFLDQVLVSGFAYKSQKNRLEPCLTDKFGLVYSFSDSFQWQNWLYYNNILETFWKRGVFETCGIRGQVFTLSGLRDFSEKRLEKIRHHVVNSIRKIDRQESWLDLF